MTPKIVDQTAANGFALAQDMIKFIGQYVNPDGSSPTVMEVVVSLSCALLLMFDDNTELRTAIMFLSDAAERNIKTREKEKLHETQTRDA